MVSKTILPYVIVVFVGVNTRCSAEQSTEMDLRESCGNVVHTSILFRHGNRTPVHTFPTDPHQISFWKEGSGQLTKIGKLVEYQLGKWIRQRYADLLVGKPYRYDKILVNSSDVDRTLMSAELLLAGLYPPDVEEMWTNEIRWQPIPVHTLPKTADNVISLDRPCERYELEKDLLNNSPEFTAFFDEHRDIFEYVSTHSGVEMTKDDVFQAITDFSDIHDALLVEDQNNLTIPTWARKIFPQPMKSVADFYFSTIAYTDEMRRLKGGPLLKTIVDDLSKKAANGLANRTFHIYSGHDATISVLLDTLDVFNRIAPPYASAVIVELRKKLDDYFVPVLYRNSSLEAPYLLAIPGCGSDVCTLDEFIRVSASKIPSNWESECELGWLMKLYYYTYVDLVVLVVLFLIIVAVILIIAKLHFMRLRRYRHYQTIQDHVLTPEGV